MDSSIYFELVIAALIIAGFIAIIVEIRKSRAAAAENARAILAAIKSATEATEAVEAAIDEANEAQTAAREAQAGIFVERLSKMTAMLLDYPADEAPWQKKPQIRVVSPIRPEVEMRPANETAPAREDVSDEDTLRGLDHEDEGPESSPRTRPPAPEK